MSKLTNSGVSYCIDFSGNRSSKTFKPKKNIPEGTHQYDLMKHAAATLGSGNLRLAVMLPEGEDLNEWVAVNSKFLFTFFFCMYIKKEQEMQIEFLTWPSKQARARLKSRTRA